MPPELTGKRDSFPLSHISLHDKHRAQEAATTKLRKYGHTYFLERSDENTPTELGLNAPFPPLNPIELVKLSHAESLRWVVKAVVRNRVRELQGNLNPLIIGELPGSSQRDGRILLLTLFRRLLTFVFSFSKICYTIFALEM